MIEKVDRLFYFILFMILNLGVVWFTLALLTTAPSWIVGLLLLAAIIEDSLVFGWSTNQLPNYGATSEIPVSTVWSCGQILQIIALAVLVGGTSIPFGIIVFVLSIFWMKIRGAMINKTMDLRE